MCPHNEFPEKAGKWPEGSERNAFLVAHYVIIVTSAWWWS